VKVSSFDREIMREAVSFLPYPVAMPFRIVVGDGHKCWRMTTQARFLSHAAALDLSPSLSALYGLTPAISYLFSLHLHFFCLFSFVASSEHFTHSKYYCAQNLSLLLFVLLLAMDNEHIPLLTRALSCAR
jgi:hypothetical protein